MKAIRGLVRSVRRRVAPPPAAAVRPPSPNLITSQGSAVEQLVLLNQYREARDRNAGVPAFRDAGLRVMSQHDEDGYLLYIFALIGMMHKVSVEICAGDGIECNTANLLVHHGWSGLLVDGQESNIQKARQFYATHPNTRYWPPKTVHAWITRENVNGLIEEAGITGEIDLLSLDIDGIDYWLWESLEVVRPRVVVLEFNHLWGPEASVSVPYRPDFRAIFTEYGSDYAGASLAAFVKLGRRKGYRLVGANRIATNAFFVRDEIECRWLPEVAPESLFGHPRARFGMTHRLPLVRDMEWVPID